MRSGRYVSDVADYVGELLVAARTRYASEEGPDAGLDASASFISEGRLLDRNQNYTWFILKEIT